MDTSTRGAWVCFALVLVLGQAPRGVRGEEDAQNAVLKLKNKLAEKRDVLVRPDLGPTSVSVTLGVKHVTLVRTCTGACCAPTGRALRARGAARQRLTRPIATVSGGDVLDHRGQRVGQDGECVVIATVVTRIRAPFFVEFCV